MPSELPSQPPPAPVQALPDGRFAGRAAFVQLVRDALAAAARDGWRELILCDAGFGDWPLHERLVIDSLQAWSRNGRNCIVLAAGYDTVVRQHARFVQWRRAWGHIVDARVCRQIDPVNFPTLLWSPHWTLQLLDPVRCAGVCGAEPERIVKGRELLQELMLVSSPGFPATTLGL
jgi:peptidyl-tRNA hydrolase